MGADDDRFAVRLLQLRRLRGRTQEQLANDSGLSVRGIRALECGRVRAPRRRTAALLAVALGLEGADLEGFLALAVASRGGPGVPSELPPALNDLTGRGADLDRLTTLSATAVTGPAVVVLHGLAGIGKTSLAIHTGHQLRPAFPDGQLFADLLGGAATPSDVLGRLLRSLGVTEIPGTAEERTALYRTVTHDRRLVVLLDNAADEGQVRALLPTGAGCFVMVTSRRPLIGLDVTDRLALTELHPAPAGDLLRSIIGPRAAEEPETVAELADLCDRLPLALRIAGNRLAGRPTWTVAQMTAQLRDESTRLGALTAGDQEIREAFSASYDRLKPLSAQTFRRCSLLAPGGFGVTLAAVTVDLGETTTEMALEDLVDAGLLQICGARYRFPDLVRLFAKERLDQEEPVRAVVAARERMICRLVEWTAAAAASFEPWATGTYGSAGYVPGPGVDPMVS